MFYGTNINQICFKRIEFLWLFHLFVLKEVNKNKLL